MHVLISGAGVAGPTLAWFLAKSGAHVTVVEKSESFLAQGQNIDINGSAVTAVKKMGLLDEIRRLNTTEKGTRFIDSEGRPFAPFPVRQGNFSFTSEFEILRGDLASVLQEASRTLPNVKYVFNTTVKTVVSNDHDTVTVELSNGEVHKFDLLVAADGQWSRVREQCFAAEQIKVFDTGAYTSYFTVPRLAIDDDWWSVYVALRSRVVTIRPDPYGTMRAMLSCMPSNDAHRRAWQEASRGGKQKQTDLMKKEFADAGWQAERLLGAMDQAPDFYLQAIQQIRMSTWSNCRVVCLGDAAYAPTPFTGAGATLAIVGAYILAGELSELGAGEHPSKALKAYESKFRPFVEETQSIPSFVPDIAHPGTAWKRWLLQTFVSTLSKVMSSPWVVGKIQGGEARDDGFPLPTYSKLDGCLK